MAATRLVCHGGLSHIEEPLHYYYDKTCPTSVGAFHRQPNSNPNPTLTPALTLTLTLTRGPALTQTLTLNPNANPNQVGAFYRAAYGALSLLAWVRALQVLLPPPLH